MDAQSKADYERVRPAIRVGVAFAIWLFRKDTILGQGMLPNVNADHAYAHADRWLQDFERALEQIP